MASDDIFSQVEALIASDQRQQPPELVDRVLKLVEHVPGAKPVVSLIRHFSERLKADNAELMLRTAWGELKRISFKVDNLGPERARFVNSDEMRRLIVDAVRKSEDLRDTHRVERIGKIFAHTVTLESTDLDKAEELMRVARDLSDQEVIALRDIYETQFELLQKFKLQIPDDDINAMWRDRPLKVPGVLEGELNSILLKLQGLGLIIAAERRGTVLGPNSRPFGLLAKGADFVRYIAGAVKRH